MKRFLACGYIALTLCLFCAAAESVETKRSDSESVISDDEKTSRRADVIQFGLDSEIIEVIDAMEQEKDSEPDDSLLDALSGLFSRTRSVALRDRIILYYRAIKNPSLSKFALEILSDPYDTAKSTVHAVFDYVRAVKCDGAQPLIIALLDAGNEEYLLPCIDALGDIGNDEAATFLASYLDRGDLDIPAKQALVRALGKLRSLETWEWLRDLAEDTDENTFMRMYAAEAIGNMKKPESVPVLIRLFEDNDPNLRAYVLKGLANYDTAEAHAAIMEGFRDSQYKVRLEAIESAKKQKINDAVPYLLYRAKNDPEKNVKLACFDALAEFDSSDVDTFFKETFAGKHTAEIFKLRSASLMIRRDFSAAYDMVSPELTEKLKSKNSRDSAYCHALLKMLAPISNSRLHDLCIQLVSSNDVVLQNFGIDIYTKNTGFSDAVPYLEVFIENKKSSALGRKAARALGRDDDAIKSE